MTPHTSEYDTLTLRKFDREEHLKPDLLRTTRLVEKSKKKSVSFIPYSQVRRVLHRNNYTKKEIDATWYDEFFYFRMKEDVKWTVHMIESGLVHNDNATCCQRGLEYRTSEGAQNRKINKANAWSAVLKEQERQWKEGSYQPELISKVYIAVSHLCQESANKVALDDEKECSSMMMMD